MHNFLIISKSAHTAPFIRDLKTAGRVDILLHSIISALFSSNTFREDIVLHLLLLGPPTPPRHIDIRYHEKNTISKKDLKKLLELALRKAKPGQRREVHPGVFVDDKNLETLVKEFQDDSGPIYLLDSNGIHIKEIKKENLEHAHFILGDHEGFDKQVKKFLKKECQKLSLGPQICFTSQAITIINYECDNV